MLILSRRIGEQIVIAGNICVTVVALKGGQVRIGVTAPDGVTIDRLEVAERRTREAQEAPPAPQPASAVPPPPDRLAGATGTGYTRKRVRIKSISSRQASITMQTPQKVRAIRSPA